MPVEFRELTRIVVELSSLIANMLTVLPKDKAEEYREKFLKIIGDKK